MEKQTLPLELQEEWNKWLTENGWKPIISSWSFLMRQMKWSTVSKRPWGTSLRKCQLILKCAWFQQPCQKKCLRSLSNLWRNRQKSCWKRRKSQSRESNSFLSPCRKTARNSELWYNFIRTSKSVNAYCSWTQRIVRLSWPMSWEIWSFQFLVWLEKCLIKSAEQ